MSTFNIKGTVKVDGIAQATKEAKTLNIELDKVTKRTAVKAAYAPKTMAYAKSASAQESTDYGVARTAREGGTGASARDFAQQAQGLGGLVRLYATYAANIFAVGAAFRALSGAMDTSNLVRGLDQLGAASGVALGTLSKRLVEATDGAISLRDAMSSVAKASSSGIASDDILRMGKVAKQASQALGIDMSDAVNRITRGITKLEPELLDELGIFTRVDVAVTNYAKSVGKSVSALTDFERRMSFANAVLSEGEKKFSEIDIDTNPYTKLLASIKDVGQVGLEVINKVVGPLVGYLSESPTALSAAIGVLGLALVKQAMPAIGEFKAGLSAAADKATRLAISKAADAAEAKTKIDTLSLKRFEETAEAEIAAVDHAAARIQKIKESGAAKNLAVEKLLSKDTLAIKENELSRYEKLAATQSAKADRLEAVGGDPKKIARLRELASVNREVTTSIKGTQKAHNDFIKAENKIAISRDNAAKSASMYGLTVRAAEKAKEGAIKQSIVTNAGYNASLLGVRDAMKLANAEIANSGLKLSTFQKGMLQARSGVAALGGQIAGLAGKIGAALGIFGMFMAVLAIVDGVFSKAGKEMSAFTKSVERVDAAAKTVSETMDRMHKGNVYTTASIEAQSSATIELADSLDELTKSALKAQKALNTSAYDRFKDSLFSIFGGGLENNFAEAFSTQITAAIENIERGPIKTNLQKTLGNILNVKDISNFEQLEKALEGLDPKSEIVLKIKDAIRAAGVEAGNAASKAKTFADSFKVAGDSFKALSKSFEINDPLTKFATNSIAALTNLSTVIQGPIEGSIESMQKVLNDLDTNPIFGPEASANLAVYKDKINDAAESFNRQAIAVDNLKNKLDQLKSTSETVQTRNVVDESGIAIGSERVRTKDTSQYKTELAQLENAIQAAQAAQTSAKANAESIAAKLRTSIAQGLTGSIDKVAAGIQAALAKGSTEVMQKIYAAADIVPELAAKQFDLKMQELGSEAALIKVMQQQLQETHLNTIATQINTATQKLATGRMLESEGKGNLGATKMIDEATTELASLESKAGLLKKAFKDPLGALKDLNKGIKEGNTQYIQSAELITTVAAEAAGFAQKLGIIGQQVKSIALIDKPLSILENEFKLRQAGLKLAKDENDTQAKSLQLDIERNNLSTDEIIAAKEMIAYGVLATTVAGELLAIEQEHAKYMVYVNAAAKMGNVADANKIRLKADQIQAEKILTVLSKVSVDQAGIALNISKERLAEELKLIDKASALRAIKNQTAQEEQDAKLRLMEIENTTDKDTGKYSESYQTVLNAELEAYKVVERAKREELAATEAFSTEISKLEAQRRQEEASGASTKDTDASINAKKEAYASTLGIIKKVSAAELDSIKKIEAARKKQTSLDSYVDSFKELEGVFESLGDGMSGVVSAFQQLDTVLKQNAATQADLVEKMAAADKVGNTEEKTRLEKEYTEQVKSGAQTELSAASATAGAAKKMFKEKTVAHKAFAAVEKGIALVKFAMMVKEMILDTAFTGKSIANSGARNAAGIIEASISGVRAVVNAIASLPFPANLIAGAATAAVIAGLLSSIGGKSPKVSGASAAEQQAVQGTGQDYVNGKLVDTGFGQLGDSTAKSTDIADSIDQLEKYSEETLKYDFLALNALKAIQENTKALAAKFFSIEGLISGTSAFGTDEGSSAKATALGYRKISTKILDSGIKASGLLFDMINDPQKMFQQYETVQTSKKNLLGMGSTKVRENVKPLEEEITDILSSMFRNIAKSVVELGKVFNLDTSTQLDEILRTTSVDFQVSAKGLKGEELVEAIAAEVGTTANQIVSQLYPFIEKFQQVGEGLLTTLTRINAEIATVNGLFAQMGVDFAAKFTQPMALVETVAETASVASAKATLESEQATLSQLSNIKEVNTRNGELASAQVVTSKDVEAQTEKVIAATEGYNAALQAENDAKYKIIEENIKVYDSLVLLGGGLEDFTEKARFFIDKFVPAGVQLAAKTEAVTDRMKELGLASVSTHEEFYSLVTSLDLSTEAGQELYTALMDVSPAFDDLIESTDKFLSEYGISVSGLKTILMDTAAGRLDAEAAGTQIADMLVDGIYNALADNFVSQITNIMVEGFISPMIFNLVNQAAIGAGTVQAMAVASAEDMARKVKAIADAYEIMLNSAEFHRYVAMAADMGKKIAASLGGAYTKSIKPSYTSSKNAAAEAAKRVAEERVALENKLLQILGKTDILRQRELATIHETNKALQLQIWALEDAKKAVDDLFDKLQRSITAEIKTLESQLDLAKEAKEKLTSIFEVLRDSINELLGVTVPTMQESAAKLLIKNALDTGVLPNVDELSEAISTLRTGIEEGNYLSSIDEKRASLLLINELSALQALVEPQLSEAEQSVLLLEDQIKILDLQLETAQSSLDALYGIDKSVGDVSTVLAELNSAMYYYAEQLSQANTTAQQIALQPATVTAPTSYSSGSTSTSTATKVWTASGYLSKNPDVKYEWTSVMDAATKSQFPTVESYAEWHWNHYGKNEGRAYRKGGYYPGGLAMVGEEGPELINFENPGMVYTAAQTNNLLGSTNSDEQARVNRELLEQIQLLRYEAQATAVHTSKLQKMFERVTKNGNSLHVVGSAT